MRLIRFVHRVYRLLRSPQCEVRRAWFRLYHAQRPPHDLLCAMGGYSLKVKSSSVLAESMYAGSGFENAEVTFLRRTLKPGMVVMDIGANIGVHTIGCAIRVGPEGRVHSFEPCGDTAQYLKDNVKLNALSNVRVVEEAVADRAGTSEFYVFPDGKDVYNSLGAEVRPIESLKAQKKVHVRVTTIDEYCSQWGIDRVDLLKVDVEGAEERVLRGADSVLRRSRDIKVLAELYEPSARQCGCSVKAIIDLMTSHGFGMHMLTSDGRTFKVDHHSVDCTNCYAVFSR